MKCKKCNAELAEGAKFCTNCGQVVESNELQNNVKGKKNTKKLIIGALLLIVVAAGIIAYLILRDTNGYDSYDEVVAALTDSIGKYDENELRTTLYKGNDDFLKKQIKATSKINQIDDVDSIDASKCYLNKIRERMRIDENEKINLSYQIQNKEEVIDFAEQMKEAIADFIKADVDDIEEVNVFEVYIYSKDGSKTKYCKRMHIVKINGNYYYVPIYY